MKRLIVIVSSLLLSFFMISTSLMASSDEGEKKVNETETEVTKETKKLDMVFKLPPPPFTDGIYPCSDCHDDPEDINREKRVLEDAHGDVLDKEIVLEHDAEHRWCLDCHDAENRDKLHLASGELVDFEESYKLCGQCHGTILRDWKQGVHGKRTGFWNGEKDYLLCASCHDPHSPKFKKMKPMPTPIKEGVK